MSVASQAMVVVPFGKASISAAPSLRVPVRLAIPQLSDAAAPSEAMPAEQAPGSVSRAIFATVIEGGVSSATEIVCVAVALFPLGSIAVYVIVVVPTGNRFPAGTPVRSTVTPQLSLACAVPSAASEIVSPQVVAPAP